MSVRCLPNPATIGVFGYLQDVPCTPASTHQASAAKICLSKSQGGLGVIDTVAWGKGAYCGLIFKILTNPDSLGVN